MPTEINMHAINDYLHMHPGLSHAECRVAYYTIHSDYGRHKNGLFWESAESIARKIHADRKIIKRTWGKMVELGWLSDTGRKVGRAKIYRIEYLPLWNEASASRRENHNPLPLVIQEMVSQSPSIGEPVSTNGEPVPISREPVTTTPPNHSSEKKPPKEIPTAFLSSIAAPDSLDLENGEAKTPTPSVPDQVQGKTIPKPREQAPLPPRPDAVRFPDNKWALCEDEAGDFYLKVEDVDMPEQHFVSLTRTLRKLGCHFDREAYRWECPRARVSEVRSALVSLPFEIPGADPFAWMD